METFIAGNGPYDAVLAYSHGAQLVASMLARLCAQNNIPQPFQCAVFISGGLPYDFHSITNTGKLEYLHAKPNEAWITIPTTNIWGRNDMLYPGMSETLSQLCQQDWNEKVVHNGGHDIPGSKAKDDLLSCVKAIRRTIDRAVFVQ